MSPNAEAAALLQQHDITLLCTSMATDGAPHRVVEAAKAEENVLVVADQSDFVTFSEKYGLIYSLSPAGGGSLRIYRPDFSAEDTPLREIFTNSTSGETPCHLAFVENQGVSSLVVVNYAGSSISSWLLDGAGLPIGTPHRVTLEGSGPLGERQEASHPHYALHVPGSDLVLVLDLGDDSIRTFRIDGSAALEQIASTETFGCTGPRHAQLTSRDELVLAGELNQTVQIGHLDRESGIVSGLRAVESTRKTKAAPNFPSHIELSGDERFVFIANRGQHTVSALEIVDGILHFRAEVVSGGRWPQHFSVTPADRGYRLLIANRDADRISEVFFDPEAWSFTEPEELFQVPKPSWIHVLGALR